MKQNKKGIEENPVNAVIKPSCESNSFDAASNQQGHVHSGDQLVTQASSHTSSILSELEEFNLASEKVDDDNTKGNAGAHIKEKSLVNVDEDAMEFTPLVLDLVSSCDKEPLESSPFSKSFDGFDKNFCGAGTKENSGICVEENSHVINEENALKKSTPLVTELISPGKKGPCEGAFFSESFNDVDEKVCRDLAGIKEDTDVGVDYSDVSVEESSHVIFEENGMKRSNSEMLELISSYEKELSASSYLTGAIDVVDENACSVSSSAATSVQNAELLGTVTDNIADETECIFDGLDTLASSKMDFSFMSSEISNTQMEPLTLNSSLCWDSHRANSSENFSFEVVSCKTNLVDVVGYTSDSSRLLELCAPASVVPW
ncbi:hypothetical protein O6P43_029166 [Quillaja saponaria]|uniref:Uncharacterized protein n=1 Tax=Quillaja saponaria TaxID=32244 RepID=A0AAD7KZG1_QUISA|nr:hypothetical protein O6P43_029166 [Quillaja saponaria]KAJ7948726.1 hypothetical protein O6P43_029166 [Quillaja saponaria]